MDLRNIEDNLDGLSMKFEAAESMLLIEPPVEDPPHRDPLRAPETDQMAEILRQVLTLKKDHTAKMEYLMQIEDKYAKAEMQLRQMVEKSIDQNEKLQQECDQLSKVKKFTEASTVSTISNFVSFQF
eukprot:TRINITY_DN10164_c0_g2_i1.p1 TRINITY_DN10164_c0_g2~~TRINITY_DN10164_c0_g2_i1.p1  ORF type:complete len:127 (+),score=30.41 TRINITY_DN10164_c0_g2_i1:47-427(+)